MAEGRVGVRVELEHAGISLPVGASGPGDHYLSWSRMGRSTLATYVVGLLLILLAWAAGTIAIQLALQVAGRPEPASPAGRLAFITATFALGVLAVPAVVHTLLRRPGWTVAAGRWPGRPRHLLVGAGTSLATGVAVDLLVAPMLPVHRAAFDPSVWLPLAVVALVGFLVQAGFEELVFRGYLMQAVASRTSRTAVVIGLPAAAFALPHWGNLVPYGNNPLQLAPYLLMGLTLGWAAREAGSLWLPLGLHWANNAYATLLVTTTGDMLPTGAPLARDLATLPLSMIIATTALQCGLQVVVLRVWQRPRLR